MLFSCGGEVFDDGFENIFISFIHIEFTIRSSLSVSFVCGYVGEELQSEIKIPAVKTRSFDTHNILWFCKKKVILKIKQQKLSFFFIFVIFSSFEFIISH